MTKSRRFIIALVGIACLTALGIYNKDAGAVAASIAMIAMGVAGANAFEAKQNKAQKPE